MTMDGVLSYLNMPHSGNIFDVVTLRLLFCSRKRQTLPSSLDTDVKRAGRMFSQHERFSVVGLAAKEK